MKVKYWVGIEESGETCIFQLTARSDSGARKQAKAFAKSLNRPCYDITYMREDGVEGRLCNDIRRWA